MLQWELVCVRVNLLHRYNDGSLRVFYLPNHQLVCIEMHTRSTLVIDGIEVIRAPTTSFIPSFFETIRKGLSARKALRAFKDLRESAPPPPVNSGITSSAIDDITTKKSRAFHVDLM